MTIKLSCTTWDKFPENAKALRKQVFELEQGVPSLLEQDALDPESLHFVMTKGDLPLAVGRLTLRDTQAKISHLAIHPSVRGKSIGGKLALIIIKEAVRRGAVWLRLSSSTISQGFCAKFGFFPIGPTYTANGLEHIDMINTSPELILSTPLSDLNGHANFILEKDATVHDIKDLKDFKLHVAGMVPQARRQLFILSHSLEHSIFDNEVIRNSVSHLARAHAMTEVKILVYDDKPLVMRQHQVIELMKRIPSRIQLRIVNRERQHEEMGMVLVDNSGVVYQRNLRDYKGFANYDHAARVRQMKEKFTLLWEYSRPSPEFREIAI
ncbi:MAG: GNAT family N-acetyltransferase [Hahellaceae bacterium]|nr:GNAT family N-acetyltransferase [Hahellaceae bacterium]